MGIGSTFRRLAAVLFVVYCAICAWAHQSVLCSKAIVTSSDVLKQAWGGDSCYAPIEVLCEFPSPPPCLLHDCVMDAQGQIHCAQIHGEYQHETVWMNVEETDPLGYTGDEPLFEGQDMFEQIACVKIVDCLSGAGNCILLGNTHVCQDDTNSAPNFDHFHEEHFPTGEECSPQV